MARGKPKSLSERIGWNHNATVYTAVMAIVCIGVQLAQGVHP